MGLALKWSQAISDINGDRDLRGHMTSLRHNELKRRLYMVTTLVIYLVLTPHDIFVCRSNLFFHLEMYNPKQTTHSRAWSALLGLLSHMLLLKHVETRTKWTHFITSADYTHNSPFGCFCSFQRIANFAVGQNVSHKISIYFVNQIRRNLTFLTKYNFPWENQLWKNDPLTCSKPLIQKRKTLKFRLHDYMIFCSTTLIV